MAAELTPENQLQTNLFVPEEKTLQSAQLMKSVDAINQKMGKNTVFFLACGTKQDWKLRSAQKSKKFTTSWEELMVVG